MSVYPKVETGPELHVFPAAAQENVSSRVSNDFSAAAASKQGSLHSPVAGIRSTVIENYLVESKAKHRILCAATLLAQALLIVNQS
ncbi:MAG TPA: hypothetical protein PK264_16285 [Hyphomicrobiaceae bacterium]|nr:hypothetical protein [Hyphomicrobiaceae bacterium]